MPQNRTEQAIARHARGRQIVECEAFENEGKTILKMNGYITTRSMGTIVVVIPSSNKPVHRFSQFDKGDGYGYEDAHKTKRGWRLKLSQINLAEIPEDIQSPPE